MLQRRRGTAPRRHVHRDRVRPGTPPGIGEALVDHPWTAYDTSPDEALGYAHELERQRRTVSST